MVFLVLNSEIRIPNSAIPAYRQAGAFEYANFFMEDTRDQYLKN